MRANGEASNVYTCKLCSLALLDRASLIEHLKTDHEPMEMVSYAAVTMMDDQSRDVAALDFHRRFVGLKRIVES